MIRPLILLAVISLLAGCAAPASTHSHPDTYYGPANLVLVTMDGVRWQEVFGGIDADLINDTRYTRNPDRLNEVYGHEERSERRRRLFPFLWSVVNAQGALMGDRENESFMEVSNPWWFSYPGYNEILAGRPDPSIDSNAKKLNPNTTFLEVLNRQDGYRGRVRVFASWDVFPFIVNTQRSGIPVNAGYTTELPATTARTRWLNEVSAEAPTLWSTVRPDFLTHGYALESLKTQRPRVIYIAFGETDDFAHDESYDRYIDAAHRNDLMLSRLWNWLQSDAYYRDNTTLIVTTDHGRGNLPENWWKHSRPTATAKDGEDSATNESMGSDQIWLAAIGPGIPSTGVLVGHWKQSQIAATALALLQVNPRHHMPEADAPIEELLANE